MKRVAFIAAAVVALMAARPGSEQQLIQQLNGQPARPIMVDGGAWGIFTTFDGGALNNTACVLLTGLRNNVGVAVTPNVVLLSPQQGVNICVTPSVNAPAWDGGCNLLPRDPNYGLPLAAVPQYITPDSAARTICAVGDAGSLSLPLWWAQ